MTGTVDFMQIRSLGRAYPPTDQFKVEIIIGSGGPMAVGFGAPRAGRLPCVLALVAGGECLQIVKAARYSNDAATAGIRYGWCGFKIDGLDIAAALGETVEIRCVADGKTLMQWRSLDLLESTKLAPEKHHLTVSELIMLVRGAYGCTNVDQLRALGSQLRRALGDEALVDGAYRWLLGRKPSAEEVGNLTLSVLPRGWQFMNLASLLVGSDEFKEQSGFPVLGPFEANFPFDLLSIWD